MDASEWDKRYAEAPRMWGSAPNRTIVLETGQLPPGRAVDLGCGDGRHSAWLGDLGWRVDAVDFSSTAIEQARARPETDHARIDWIVADAQAWEPPEPVELVLIAYLHVPGLQDIIERALGWLGPEGRLMYLGHAKENLAYGVGGPPDPAILPDINALAPALAGCHVRRLQHIERSTETGTAIDLLAVASPWPGRPTRADPDDGRRHPHP